jgi:hypothetical protein
MDITSKLSIVLALLSLGVGIAAAFAPYEWRQLPPSKRRIGLGLGFIFIIAAFASLVLIPGEAKPDVTLRFVTRKTPSFQMINTSRAIATNIKYHVAAFMLDPQTNQPVILPIPADIFDLLTPQNSTLPINIFQTPMVKPFVKDGSRIFGSASIMCPLCKSGRTFFFFIEWGKGGWYSEDQQLQNGNILIPKRQSDVETYLNQYIFDIPFYRREQIEDIP